MYKLFKIMKMTVPLVFVGEHVKTSIYGSRLNICSEQIVSEWFNANRFQATPVCVIPKNRLQDRIKLTNYVHSLFAKLMFCPSVNLFGQIWVQSLYFVLSSSKMKFNLVFGPSRAHDTSHTLATMYSQQCYRYSTYFGLCRGAKI